MRVSQYLWHSFIPELFDRDGIALDLGANHGQFSEYLADKFKIVLAVEPNPEITYPSPGRNVELQRCAVGWPGGEARFCCREIDVSSGLLPGNRDSNPDSAGDASISVRVVTLSDLLAAYAGEAIAFVKMDVEGAELDIFLNEPAEVLGRIKQLTVEFHDFVDPASLPRIKQAIERMEGLGFAALRFSVSTYGDVLFLNRRYVAVGTLQEMWWLFRFKLCRGVLRRIRRTLGLEGRLPAGYAFLR